MCIVCEKTKILKELMTSYFTDEELVQVFADYDLTRNDPKGIRVTLAVLAIVELCCDEGLSGNEIHEGVDIALLRDRVKRLNPYHRRIGEK